jgi:hypothetical protein
MRVILSSIVLPFVGRLYNPTIDRAARIVSFVRSKSAEASGKSCSGIYWSAEYLHAGKDTCLLGERSDHDTLAFIIWTPG